LTDFSLNWLRELGSLGLFGAMFIEGTSLPFPGIVVVFAYGYMLSYDLFYTSKVAMGMSIMYCVASLIPYFMGNKLMGLIFKKQNKGLEKAKALFNRYGFWSVAFFRPFGLGNYISCVAGMSNMGLVHYLFLTFLGIYPWAFVVLSLGKYFKGNYEAVISFYYKNSVFIYGTAILILITIICLYIGNRKK
jgi:membrane protein DedA with SNARE-associated domain